MPDSGPGQDGQGLVAQILVQQTQMAIDIAVIKERTTAVADHEERIRQNSADIVVLKTQSQTGRDLTARLWAAGGVAISGAGVGAAWYAILHR